MYFIFSWNLMFWYLSSCFFIGEVFFVFSWYCLTPCYYTSHYKMCLFVTFWQLKSVNFIVSLFCTILKYRIIITFLFSKFQHESLFKSYLYVNRYGMEISFQNDIFHTDFNNFNLFLANFNSFGILRSAWRLLSVIFYVM